MITTDIINFFASARRWNLSRALRNENNKLILLTALVLQTTASVLMLRYSKLYYPPYKRSTAVVFLESVKLITCLGVLWVQNSGFYRAWEEIRPHLSFKTFGNLLIPASLYVVQNNLLHIALKNLDAPLYTVIYELKVLWTAVFSVFWLGRTINRKQFLCLVGLFLGVVVVELQLTHKSGVVEVPREEGPEAIATPWWNSAAVIGFGAVFVASITSGFAGVEMERLYKDGNISFWVRNTLLAFISIFIAAVCVEKDDGWRVVLEEGVFNNYSPFIWAIILVQAAGGLIVALVVAKLDNIVKGFANGISVVLGCLLSIYLFDFHPSISFLLGSSLVVGSAYYYKLPSTAPVISVSAAPTAITLATTITTATATGGAPTAGTAATMNGTGHDTNPMPIASPVPSPIKEDADRSR